ncbi:MAG: hypothetical protein ACJAV0_001270 [Shewanella sp.]|jgi:hypothetical protein
MDGSATKSWRWYAKLNIYYALMIIHASTKIDDYVGYL